MTFDFGDATFDFDGGLSLINGTLIAPDTVDGDVDNDDTVTTDGTVNGNVNNSGLFQLGGGGVITGNVVNSGRFESSGTINGNFTNNAESIHAPGGSIGTTFVLGDYDENGLLEIEVDGTAVDGTEEADLVDVTGTAEFFAGAAIQVLPEDADDDGEPDTADGNLADGDQFLIVTADVDLILPTDDAEANYGLTLLEDIEDWDFLLSLAGNDLFLITEAAIPDFGELAAGAGPSVTAIAGALDSLVIADPNDPLVQSLETLLDNAPAGQEAATFQAAAPEVGPGAYDPSLFLATDVARLYNSGLSHYLSGLRNGMPQVAMTDQFSIQGGGMLASAADDPAMLAAAIEAQSGEGRQTGEAKDFLGDHRIADKPLGVFGRALGVFQDRDTTADRLGYSADSYGGLFGVDYAVRNDLVLGVSLGYFRTEADLDQNRGDHDIDTVRIGPYVSYYPMPWFIDASLTYGYHSYDTTRNMPSISTRVDSDHDGHDLSAFVRGGYAFDFDRLRVTPEGSLQYLYLYEESFQESGASGLSVDSRDADSLRSRLGVTASYMFDTDAIVLVPEAFVGWEHEFLGEADDATGRFNGGGNAFTVTTGEADEDSLYVRAGLTALFDENFSAFVQYEGSISSDTEVHGVSGGVQLRF